MAGFGGAGWCIRDGGGIVWMGWPEMTAVLTRARVVAKRRGPQMCLRTLVIAWRTHPPVAYTHAVRVVLIAPACDGTDVGEAWMAYKWVEGLCSHCDVTVLTSSRPGRVPTSVQLPQAQVVEWPEPHLFAHSERFASMLKPGYLAFYWRARRWLRNAIVNGEVFDVVHQPVPEAMRYPCPATGLGLPIVLGPVAGSLRSPPGFAAEEGATPWFVRLRALDGFRLRWDPWLRRTYSTAACVVGVAPYVAEHLASNVSIRRFEQMGDTAVDESSIVGRVAPVNDAPNLRLLFVGRVIRTKGVRDIVRAMSLTTTPCTLDVVGDGDDRAACEQAVATLGLTQRVTFHGRIPRETVNRFYERADVFVFPSYREPGGNVVFEAMAHGLPLIVSDRGGPAATVNQQCALTVTPTSPKDLASQTAQAIDMMNSPQRREAMGTAAVERLREIGLWGPKVEQMIQIFRSVTVP